MSKKVVVFAGNECTPTKEKYYFPLAYQTGRLLAQAGYITITGGGPGLMNQVSQGAYEAGGKTIGICLQIEGRIHSKFLTQREIYKDLIERQRKLISMADAYIALPGGVGTHFEIFEVISLKRKKEIDVEKPLIIIDNFFIPLKNLLNTIKIEGFINNKLNNLYHFVQSPQKALSLLKKSL